jgi:hypothetical protein
MVTPRAPGPPSSAQVLAARRRARDRSLVRDGLLVVLAVVCMWGAWAVRETPNAARPPAVELTARLDDLFRQVRAGTLVLDTTPRDVAPGIAGARFPGRTLGDRWVLAGTSDGECYVLWWDEDGARRGRVLASDMPCTPSTEAMSTAPNTYRRLAAKIVEDPDAPNTWAGVLPDPVRLRWWFLPVMVVGGGVLLAALVRISIAALTGAAPSATRR